MSSCTISCIAAVRKPEAHPPTDSDGKSGICLIYCSTECGDIFDVTSTPNRLALPRTRAEKGAYDRLAAVKFREHKCEAETRLSPAKQETKLSAAATAFAELARVLIKRGYTPKVAVELVLQETEVEHGNDPRIMEKARADGEDFLLRARKGLI